VRALLKHQCADEPVATDKSDRNTEPDSQHNETATYVCRNCGAPMIIIEHFMRGQMPRAPPANISGSQ
jgi:hypothetical protein